MANRPKATNKSTTSTRDAPHYLAMSYVHPKTGRIHPRFRQIKEAGRMATTEPNLLGVPKDTRYRQCFIASPGYALVKADYSAIELRIAAEIAEEDVLLRIFSDPDTRRGDPHYQMAALLTKKPLEEITREERDSAKIANFGLLYGAEADELRAQAANEYQVFLTPEAAETMVKAFRTLYPAIYRW